MARQNKQINKRIFYVHFYKNFDSIPYDCLNNLAKQ